MSLDFSLDIGSLQAAYRSSLSTPSTVVAAVYDLIETRGEDHVWTHVVPRDVALERARHLERTGPRNKPLYGIPFSVKDNIHVADLPTTAGCAAFSRIADRTATAVKKTLNAGGILIGKNNMDQFATGLVGIRNPAGYCRNAFDVRYIPGGSSSGSGVAVAAGLVSFSLGSDTGGSGRVPAALNNVVGLKPTVGLVSSAGMVYCNRSFDCMSVFALTCDDASQVLAVIRGYDDADSYSREDADEIDLSAFAPKSFRFGVPGEQHLTFFGDAHAERMFESALATLERLGGKPVEIDFTPFLEAGQMLFNAPLLSERFAEYGAFVKTRRDDVHPVVRDIIGKAESYCAAEAYRSLYRLQALKQQARRELAKVEVLFLPTTGTIYRCEEVEVDPVRLNANMGYYTYFVNPLDLCALAVPAGIRPDGLPFGVSLIGRAGQDRMLHGLGRLFQAAAGNRLGATRFTLKDIPGKTLIKASPCQATPNASSSSPPKRSGGSAK